MTNLTGPTLCLALAACGGQGFDLESVLEAAPDAQCETNAYWPAAVTHFPASVFRVDAPAPPYEITGFSGLLYNSAGAFNNDRACRPGVGLRVFAFIHEGDPSGLPVTDAGALDVTVLAEATLSGAGSEDFVSAEVLLDPPVQVDDSGTLWLGFDATEDGGSGAGACVAGCEANARLWHWFADGNWFNNTRGWSAQASSKAHLSVTVRHD